MNLFELYAETIYFSRMGDGNSNSKLIPSLRTTYNKAGNKFTKLEYEKLFSFHQDRSSYPGPSKIPST